MAYILFFIIGFIIVYLFYSIFVIRKSNALKKMRNSKELKLLCRLNKIKVTDDNLKELVKNLAIGNAFIISFMATLIIILERYISNFYLWIILSALIALVLLVPLIIGTYKIAGKLIKKERK